MTDSEEYGPGPTKRKRIRSFVYDICSQIVL